MNIIGFNGEIISSISWNTTVDIPDLRFNYSYVK